MLPETQDQRLERISSVVYEAAKNAGATPVEAFAAAQGIYATVRRPAL